MTWIVGNEMNFLKFRLFVSDVNIEFGFEKSDRPSGANDLITPNNLSIMLKNF